MDKIDVETPPCPMCHKKSQLQVPLQGLEAWRRGELIQRALPELTADEREMLMTGTHPDCWDKMFEER